jgi:hypothetical protein
MLIRVRHLLRRPLDGPDAAHPLLQFLLGLAIRLIDRPGRLAQVAEIGVAEPTDRGHDVEAEFVIGQGEMGLGLGPVGAEEAEQSGL